MSNPESGDIEPFDWFNKFFGGSRRNHGWRGFSFPDVFRSMDEMRRDIESEFEDMFKGIENTAPKDLIREYETSEGGKVKEYGPFVYGYSMTIGPDGKPKVREFGNVKSPLRGRGLFRTTPEMTSVREPLADVTTTDKDIKVVMEMPGVTKSNIKISAYDNSVEVQTTEGAEKKYHEVINLPEIADIETARSTYNNGILEIIFKKKDQTKPTGKEIKID